MAMPVESPGARPRLPKIVRVAGCVLAWLAVFAASGLVSSARAEGFGIAPGSFAVRTLSAEGDPESRAGSHPDLQIDFGLQGESSPQEMQLEMPPGLGGDPNAVPACSGQTRAAGEECPADTQVGVFKLGPLSGAGLELPIYHLEPGPGQAAAFGSMPGIEFESTMQLRPADFGITFTIANLPEFPLSEGHIEIWGVPADHQTPPGAERRPFLTTPSTCGPLVFTLRVRSRQAEAPWLSATAQTSPPQSGCESLPFTPGLGLHLGNPVADSPTGVQMELTEPEAGDEGELADAQLKQVTVQLPAGMTVAPAAARALTACSDAAFGLGDTAQASCPPGSTIGSVEITSPAFNEPLAGAVYLGEEAPGERFRLLVAVPAPGFTIKLVGALNADPATGRLSTTLSNLPPAGLTRMLLSLDGGPNGLIASPLACGPVAATAQFVPYGGGPPVSASATVAIAAHMPDLPCPGPLPFAPQMTLTQSTDQAGGASTLSVALRRADGEQLPRRFSFVLPPGLSAALGSVPLCSTAQAAVAACPAASSVGTVIAAAGPGDAPAQLPGEVYLTGPYRRAPFGLLIEIGAQLGPFALGSIDFRAAIELDGRSGRVQVTSDPVPETLAGVQVRLRTIELSLDRPGFLRNPTSCRAAQVDGTVEAASGISAAISSPFKVSGCKRLRLRPRFHFALQAGAGRRGARVALRLRVQMRPGETSLRTMRIALPRALGFDLAGVGAICSIPAARHGECPRRARIGTVQARSPLLDEPLQGAAYVADPGDQGQPDVWISLAGAGIALEMKGTTRLRHGRFVLNLSGLPDMPLSVLDLQLGRVGGGVLSLRRALCRDGRRSSLTFPLFIEGQDEARHTLRPAAATEAHCRISRHVRHGHRGRRSHRGRRGHRSDADRAGRG